MRDAALAALLALSIVPLGCGYGSYEARLEATESRLKDELILNQSLAGPVRGEFAEEQIYLRPPQGLSMVDQFQPAPIPPNYDIEASFIRPGSEDKLPDAPQLHVLARHETEGDEEAEGGEEQAPRGDFRATLRQDLSEVYGQDAATAETKPVSKTAWPRTEPPNQVKFDRMEFFSYNDQLVHVYLYPSETEATESEYDVALIWEFPKGQAPGDNLVDLTLGTFAVGASAGRSFRGETDSNAVGGGAGGGGGGSAVAF